MATLLLVGCGKMGGALARGWLEQGASATDITVVEPNPDGARDITANLGVAVVSSADDLSEGFKPDVVVVAVKPQILEQVLVAYARFVKDDALFLSIAAGKTLGAFEAVLGTDAQVVRAMPNTPASVGRGIAVCVANEGVSQTGKDVAGELLKAVGEVAWVDDETLLDAVTAVSGSGPAYIFLLAEAMAHAGVMAGLPVELSDKLARATVAGAGEMLHQLPEPAETLRSNVTSPGGTTAAALEVLMADGGLKELMVKAIDAATRRSRDLAG